jgi:magnesium chelatase family protein
VNNARRTQIERYKAEGIYFNSQLKPKHINTYCSVGSREKQLLKQAFEKYNLSARAYNRILKVARTIADLENADDIAVNHIAEALQHRCLDRKYTI